LLLQSRVIICMGKNYYMLLIVNKIERKLLQYKLVLLTINNDLESI